VIKIRVTDCVTCGRAFVAHGQQVKATACSAPCRRKRDVERQNRRAKHRQYLRRTRSASDITPQEEAEMRRKARKCPMPGCGVWMTGKPGLPNSKELDHILPINQGGTHTHGNVRIICRTCNLKRPKDGRDYAGTFTLWAQAPGVAVVTRKPKKPRTQLRTCKCGASFAAPGYTFMCPACIEVAAHRAAKLHAEGMTWRQVAQQTGYATAEGARYAAKRIGYTAPPQERKPPRESPRCACGGRLHPGSRHCADCIKSRAERAAHLRYEEGWTLRQIATELGYTSVESVRNHLKTAGSPAPQPYWRPGT
jgi:5-methylcytosine-specific restriction endonuclease McrA